MSEKYYFLLKNLLDFNWEVEEQKNIKFDNFEHFFKILLPNFNFDQNFIVNQNLVFNNLL